MLKIIYWYILFNVIISGSIYAEEGVIKDINASLSNIITILKTSGLCGFILLIILVVVITFIIESILTIRTSVLIPEKLVEEVDGLLDAGEYEKALEICKGNDCLAGRVLTAILDKVGYSFERMHSAFVDEMYIERTLWKQRVNRLLILGNFSILLAVVWLIINVIELINKIANYLADPLTTMADIILVQIIKYHTFSALICLLLSVVIYIMVSIGRFIFNGRLERNFAALTIISEDVMDVFRPLPEDIN